MEVVGVFIGPNPISSCWTESSSFLSTSVPDSPVRTGQGTVHCPVPATSADRWVCSSGPLDPTVTQTVWCTPNSPMLQPGGTYLWAPLRRLSGCPTGQSGAHQTVIVHYPVRHQALADCPFSLISSLSFLASILLESWTSMLIFVASSWP
jgi:hypothetical protein